MDEQQQVPTTITTLEWSQKKPDAVHLCFSTQDKPVAIQSTINIDGLVNIIECMTGCIDGSFTFHEEDRDDPESILVYTFFQKMDIEDILSTIESLCFILSLVNCCQDNVCPEVDDISITIKNGKKSTRGTSSYIITK